MYSVQDFAQDNMQNHGGQRCNPSIIIYTCAYDYYKY